MAGPVTGGPAPEIVRAGHVLTPDELLSPGWVHVAAGRVVAVGQGSAPPVAGRHTDLGARTVVPGYVDVHCHGGGGRTFTEGVAAARAAAAAHRSHGTTSVMASLVTDTVDVLEGQVRELAPLVRDDELLGVHLEGPWLSGSHCGAHDPGLMVDPEPGQVDRLLAAGVTPGRPRSAVRMVTMAVERAGACAAVARMVADGVLVALGHSRATWAEAGDALDAGARVGTHLFNAERPLGHREPGLIGALLDREDTVVELIADGVHLHPQAVRLVAAAKPGGFVLITDAMAAAAAGDGDYRLGPLDVRVEGGVARVAGSDTVAGSTATMDAVVAHAARTVGLGLAPAVRAATSRPADLLDRRDIGRLTPGAHADLVALDDSLRAAAVMRRGRWV